MAISNTNTTESPVVCKAAQRQVIDNINFRESLAWISDQGNHKNCDTDMVNFVTCGKLTSKWHHESEMLPGQVAPLHSTDYH